MIIRLLISIDILMQKVAKANIKNWTLIQPFPLISNNEWIGDEEAKEICSLDTRLKRINDKQLNCYS